MPLDKRELQVGTRLVGRYKKQDFHAEVVVRDGREYIVGDDRPQESFKSLSAAGSAITGGAINGWRFWSLEGAANPEATEEVRRTPNQRGVPEGQVRWFCNACMSGFLAPIGETPEACPQGHRAEADRNGEVVTVSDAGETEDSPAVE